MSVILYASAQNAQETLKEKAHRLAQQFIIADGHIDLPWRMLNADSWIDVSNRTNEGDFDYVRCKEGGLDAPFMSIYVPAEYQTKGGAKEFADSLINMVHTICEKYPDKFALANSPKEVEANFKSGKISLPMGMENGAPIGMDLNNLHYYYKKGIRYITLTHSKNNQICASSYDTGRTWDGLTDFGKKVVLEMNKVGIMVDVSHLSDEATRQVLKITGAPVIASHSSCRHFTPGWERNLSDDLIKKIADNGGVVMINFGSTFLDSKVKEANNRIKEERKKLEKAWAGKPPKDKEAALKAFDSKNPKVYSTVQKAAEHIDYVVQMVGIDFVGFGSDFDGVGDSLPTGLKDASQYPNLIFELLKKGYSEQDIEKICYKNLWRVWNKVEEIAATNKP